MPRTLGSGRNLTPTAPLPQRSSSLLSPSESSLSLGSQVSTSQTSGGDLDQDLTSRISLGHGSPMPAETPSTKLECPICGEDMLTLLQLNRHLDDDHQNLEAVEQDEVKTWFKKQMVRAKRFQPLVVLNQKLKGLDVFEPNEAPAVFVGSSRNGAVTTEISPPDPDEVVTRTHWQRSTPYEKCTDPICGRPLGTTNGSINCRKCGRLFCEEHTMYQMKLSRSAQHEPVRGFWCRVCETCYKSREGYNDHRGATRDHTDFFNSVRRKGVDARYLEISRLEKRLTKLTRLLAGHIAEQGGNGGNNGLLWSLSGQRNQQRKTLEQSVVSWEDDATVAACPFCQQEFTNYSFRRHHCRLCGRVVCGDVRTGCSLQVGLNVAAPDAVSEKPSNEIHVDVRMCKDCHHTLFSRRDYAEELAKKPPDLRSYETLVQFERGIRLMLPKFQSLLTALQDPDKPPTAIQLTEASKVRRRLMDAFAQYDIAAKRIRDLPTSSSSQAKLQRAIYQLATQFLHLHMLPLKTLPKILKHASPGNNPRHVLPNGTKSGTALASIRFNDNISGSGRNGESQASSTTGSILSAMEAEEHSLRERLIVLEEQRFMVEEMLNGARKRRKFDEVAALLLNLGDLNGEIDHLNGVLERLDWAAVYGGGSTIGGSNTPGSIGTPGTEGRGLLS